MPYSRRTTKRRTYKRRGNNATHRIARYEAKKVVDRAIENKMWDGRLVLAGVDNNGVTYRLFTNPSAATTIAQGTGSDQYIGQKIRVMYVFFMLQGIYADATNMITVVIWQNKGLFAPAGSVMTNVFQSTGNDSAPLSFPDREYNDRFRILARKTFAVSQNGPSNHIIKIKLRPKKIRMNTSFNDNAGAAEAGDLWFGIISDSSAVTPPTVNAQWRVYYKDA